MTVSLDGARVAKFVATLNLLSDFARNNLDFFRDLEAWKQTGQMSESLLGFIDTFKIFTAEERGRFVEFLKVLSMVLEESEDSSQ
jgi:hypothetical protein